MAAAGPWQRSPDSALEHPAAGAETTSCAASCAGAASAAAPGAGLGFRTPAPARLGLRPSLLLQLLG